MTERVIPSRQKETGEGGTISALPGASQKLLRYGNVVVFTTLLHALFPATFLAAIRNQ